MKIKRLKGLRIITLFAIIPILSSCFAQGVGVKHGVEKHSVENHSQAQHVTLGYEVKNYNAEEYNSELSIDTNKSHLSDQIFFQDDYGRGFIHIVSEGIVALACPNYNDSFRYDFGLQPFFEEFPREPDTVFSCEEYDFVELQHRLFQAEYNLRIHYSLEPEITRIIKHNLAFDRVIRICPEISLLPSVRFLNHDIFDRFVEENVNIEIIYDDIPNIVDSRMSSYPIWKVYNLSFPVCFFTDPFDRRCNEHNLHIWLIEFTDTHRTIWDMRTVTEAGCGQPWLW